MVTHPSPAPAPATPAAAVATRLPEPGTVLARGAEARVVAARWLSREAVAKERAAKAYRHPELDQRLRGERTRLEAQLLAAARAAGVATPVVLDADAGAATLRLAHVPGPTLRAQLPRDPDAVAQARMRALGTACARLHRAGITHGDLTTSNAVVPDHARPEALVLLDFGLGQATEEVEPRGVDLHLVEEALHATDARADALFAAFTAGYQGEWPSGSPAVLARLAEIRARGRNR